MEMGTWHPYLSRALQKIPLCSQDQELLFILYRVQYLYFKIWMSRGKRKSSGDVAGITVLFKVYCTARLKMFPLKKKKKRTTV